MTITDANGNKLSEGKRAINWCAKHVHKGHATKAETDSAGRILITFQCGKVAKAFKNSLHPKLIRAIEDNIK